MQDEGRMVPRSQTTGDVKAILQERGTTHGDFADNARIAQTIKKTIRGEPGYGRLNDVQKESLDVITLKISRILSNQPDFNDHWDDIAGYATLASKDITKRKGQ